MIPSQLHQFNCRECLFGCMPVDITTVDEAGKRHRTRWGVFKVDHIIKILFAVYMLRPTTVRVIVDVALNPGKPP